MAYAALTTVQTLNPGDILLAATLQQANSNLEFLINPPACSIKHSAAQSIATATTVTMLGDTENYDNDAMHSTVTNNSRITAQTAGRYLATALVEFPTNGTGIRSLNFLVNNTTTYAGIQIGSTGSGNLLPPAARTLILSAGDYVECTAYQTAGGTISVQLVEFALMFLTRN